MNAPVYRCPSCRKPGSRIFELNTALVEIPVTSFDEKGEPDDYGEWRVVTESICRITPDRFPRYRCECGAEFEAPSRAA
jgi:hypothetical protein